MTTANRLSARLRTCLVTLATLAAVSFGGARAADPHAEHDHGASRGAAHASRHGDAHADGSHGEPEVEPGEHHDESLRLGVDELARHGIEVAAAAPGSIDAGLELLGEVSANEDGLAHLTPRFPGIVREVRRNVGDRVRKGEVLAVIESSETLAPYELTTLVDGTILAKHVTRGEAVDRDHEAFVVADLSSVWVRLRVYQRDLTRLRSGQEVRVRGGADGPRADGRIGYLTPVLDPTTRTATARVELANPSGEWRPGMFVTAAVLDPIAAAVTVPVDALQTLEGQPTVFVVDTDVSPRSVVPGRRGRTRVEIVSGLVAGERIAVTRTFLLKAELGKSEAEHHH